MKYLLIAIVATLLLTKCNTDIDLTAPYEDITVVYGLLDQSSDIQYIRINKSFLGDVALQDMAAIRDSVEYDDTDILSARVEKLDGSSIVDFWELKDTLVEAINETLFYVEGITDPLRKVYYFEEANLDQDFDYRLNIKFSNKDSVFCTTSLISNTPGAITNPQSNSAGNSSQRISFFNSPNADGLRLPKNYQFRWKSEVGAKRYALFIEMDYVEKVWESPAFENEISSEVKTLEWYMGETNTTNVAQDGTMSENLEKAINGELFTQEIASQLESNPNITREIGLLNEAITPGHYSAFRFKLVSADEDYNSFIDFAEPSTSLAQERPQWTNVTNGQGLFSSRLNQQSTDIRMDIQTMNELCSGGVTSDLNFCWKGASVLNCDIDPDLCTCFYLCE